MSIVAEIGEGMMEAVLRTSKDLRAKSYEELAKLPERDTRIIIILDKPVHLTVHLASRDTNELLVVVQAMRDLWFGITTQIRVEGFIARANGEKLKAPETLLWDYT